MMTIRSIFVSIALTAITGIHAIAQAPVTLPQPVLGTYGHPKAFWDRGGQLGEYGVNAAFIHAAAINAETVERVRSEGCLVFAEFATLNGKYGDYVKNHPEAHPIDDTGNPAPPATWFMGVCPTNQAFREYRMAALRELLTNFDVDGVWMDYLHWHAQFEDPYPVFVKTCFNDSCVSAFDAWAELEVPGDTIPERAEWIFTNAAKQWEDWRVSVIVDWAREIHDTVTELRPNALVGNFQAAWKDDDLWGARRRCLGLDYMAMEPYVDVYSPMIYHGRAGKSPDYVREYVEYFSERHPVSQELGVFPKLIPIVQAQDRPRIEPAEFETVLRHGLEAKSAGVMMFAIGSVAADDDKMDVMKRVYTEFSDRTLPE
jgi:hypothetical protein